MRGITVDSEGFRALRRARGLSQLDLAEAAGVSERTVRNAERGRPIRHDFLSYLCAALGVEVVDLALDRDELRRFQSEQKRIGQILTAIEAFARDRDLSECRRLLATNARLIIHGPAALPIVGEYRGIDGMRTLMERVEASTSYEAPTELTETRASGSLVELTGKDVIRINSSGKVIHALWQHLYEFERGRVVRIDERFDTHAWMAAL